MQRSASLWLERSQSKKDLPCLVGGFSLDLYWAQCGWVTENPQGYLECTVQQIVRPTFTNSVVLHHRSDHIKLKINTWVNGGFREIVCNCD